MLPLFLLLEGCNGWNKPSLEKPKEPKEEEKTFTCFDSKPCALHVYCDEYVGPATCLNYAELFGRCIDQKGFGLEHPSYLRSQKCP